MKKYVALILALILCLSSTSALAAGKLNVVQENFYVIPSYSSTYGYAFAKVENKGDKPIGVNAGVLEIYNSEGTALTSSDYTYAYYAYLQPGEYTYVQMYDDVKNSTTGENIVIDDYMMTLTGKSSSSYEYKRLPCTTDLKLGVKSGYSTYNYMYATVTNNTTQPIYNAKVVLALLDAEGNILYIDSDSLYNVAIAPGSSVIFRCSISSSFIDYYAQHNITPVSVDAIAYTEEYK